MAYDEARTAACSARVSILAPINPRIDVFCAAPAEVSHLFDAVECRKLLICNLLYDQASAPSFFSQVRRGDSAVGKR